MLLLISISGDIGQYPLSSDEIANRTHGHQQVFIFLKIFILILIYWGILIFTLRDVVIDVDVLGDIDIEGFSD